MITRRAVLKGAAAGSIAAIASSRGIAASPADGQGILGSGFGNLEGGAAGSFHKLTIGFDVFIKWHKSAAQLFYKENQDSNVDIFFKFLKLDDLERGGWSPLTLIQTLEQVGMSGAEAGFLKLERQSAQFFLKFADGTPPQYLTVGADGQYGFQPPYCYQPD
jgi:hypothetical protein